MPPFVLQIFRYTQNMIEQFPKQATHLPEEQPYSLNNLEQHVQHIFKDMAPTGAVDEEWGHISGYLEQARNGNITPNEAKEKIDAYIGSRQDYH